MEFFDVIKNRRSLRSFTDDPVKEEDLMAMLEAARLAPSSHNEQPWRFVVIRNDALISDLRNLVDAIIDSRIELAANEQEREKLRGQRFFATNFAKAPVVIVALSKPFPASAPSDQPVFNQGLQSVAASITHLHLAAVALGYGGCWATLPLEFAGAEIDAILEVEEPWFSVAVISIGVPAKIPREIKRKSIEEIVAFR